MAGLRRRNYTYKIKTKPNCRTHLANINNITCTYITYYDLLSFLSDKCCLLYLFCATNLHLFSPAVSAINPICMYFSLQSVFYGCANAATLNPHGQIPAGLFIIHAPLLTFFQRCNLFLKMYSKE